ncbi:hypothetical protein NDU88_006249 [Pleurodeles waltl]|uniref:Uncharacterized protein n=1 Tax=Pleurodeles waltl TaxID=8319 RepID=A0AAV7X152_PLEWA|nr:hypothetical protein NDU88_006249 [Pleurodeles waltl]
MLHSATTDRCCARDLWNCRKRLNGARLRVFQGIIGGAASVSERLLGNLMPTRVQAFPWKLRRSCGTHDRASAHAVPEQPQASPWQRSMLTRLPGDRRRFRVRLLGDGDANFSNTSPSNRDAISCRFSDSDACTIKITHVTLCTAITLFHLKLHSILHAGVLDMVFF